MLLAKLALGFGGTLALAGAYTFHEGLMRVDVDERSAGGQHVHVWLPAAMVPMAMHVTPNRYLGKASAQIGPWMPMVREFTKELAKYPDAELIDVRDGDETVHVRTHSGKLLIDVEGDETVHVVCPLAMLRDVASQLEASAPRA